MFEFFCHPSLSGPVPFPQGGFGLKLFFKKLQNRSNIQKCFKGPDGYLEKVKTRQRSLFLIGLYNTGEQYNKIPLVR